MVEDSNAFVPSTVVTGVEGPLVDDSSAPTKEPDDIATLSRNRAEFKIHNEYFCALTSGIKKLRALSCLTSSSPPFLPG